MKSLKKHLRLSRAQWISVAVLASSLGLAAAVTIPFNFNTGDTLLASSMNANFAAVANQGSIVATATTNSGTIINGSCVNPGARSVSITAPVAGRVIISGQMVLEFNHATALTDEVDVYIGTASATDCAQLSGFMTVPSVLPIATYFYSVPLTGDFPVAATSTTTFFLNMRGFGNTGHVNFNNRLVATFIPN